MFLILPALSPSCRNPGGGGGDGGGGGGSGGGGHTHFPNQ